MTLNVIFLGYIIGIKSKFQRDLFTFQGVFMQLQFINLNTTIRNEMAKEITYDLLCNQLYIGKYLNRNGKAGWEILLREAVESYDNIWLANQLTLQGYLKKSYSRKCKNGIFKNIKVPSNAPQMLADGEFNHYYSRGVCKYAIAKEIFSIEVYRGKEVSTPRTRSESLLGTHFCPERLLTDLRKSRGRAGIIGIPAGPNSGLMVRLQNVA